MRRPVLSILLVALAAATNACGPKAAGPAEPPQDARPTELAEEKRNAVDGEKPGAEIVTPIGELDTKNPHGRTFVAVSADGLILVSRSMLDRNNLQFWDPVKREKKKELSLPSSKFTLALTPDGKIAACATSSHVHFIRTSDGKEFELRPDGDGYPAPSRVRFDATGKVLFVVDQRRIFVFDIAKDGASATQRSEWKQPGEGKEAPRLEGLSNTFDKNRKIASGDENGDIKIWDTTTGKIERSLKGSKKVRLNGIAVTEDGKTMISLGMEGPAHVWNLPAGAVRRTIEDVGSWGCLALLPDQRSVLYPARTVYLGRPDQEFRDDIHLADLESGVVRRVFRGSRSAIWTIAVTGDGRRFYSSGEDATIQIWDMKAP
jgi:WD40 repeat protein